MRKNKLAVYDCRHHCSFNLVASYGSHQFQSVRWVIAVTSFSQCGELLQSPVSVSAVRFCSHPFQSVRWVIAVTRFSQCGELLQSPVSVSAVSLCIHQFQSVWWVIAVPTRFTVMSYRSRQFQRSLLSQARPVSHWSAIAVTSFTIKCYFSHQFHTEVL